MLAFDPRNYGVPDARFGPNARVCLALFQQVANLCRDFISQRRYPARLPWRQAAVLTRLARLRMALHDPFASAFVIVGIDGAEDRGQGGDIAPAFTRLYGLPVLALQPGRRLGRDLDPFSLDGVRIAHSHPLINLTGVSQEEPTKMDLNQQIACVKRELNLRRQVYPNLVRNKKMRDADANHEILAMSAVLGTLEALKPLPLMETLRQPPY